VLALLCLSASADARPGGGQGFGGGGGGGGGFSGGGGGGGGFSGGGGGFSGGGGGGDLGAAGGVGVLVLSVAFGLLSLYVRIQKDWRTNWETSEPLDYHEVFAQQRRASAPVKLETLRAHDPNFSQILLEDFLYELYTRAAEARGNDRALERLAPYLSADVRGRLRRRHGREVAGVSGVIVGAMKIIGLRDLDKGVARIRVEYESNFTEEYADDGRQGFYALERWTLRRKLGAKSPPPNELRAFDCPSCGAPVDSDELETCKHCGTQYSAAEHDWYVEKIDIVREEMRGPALTTYAEEAGTHNPTIRARDRKQQLAALMLADPAFTEDNFKARVELVYHALNEGWTNLDWASVRPYTTDRFWRAQRYWIEAYEKQGLRNVIEDATLDAQQLAKVERDPFFYAITVRILAHAKDRTVLSKNGRHVAGDPISPRRYSEYWTFIRSVERTGPASVKKECPSCGAALEVNMAGQCNYCQVMVAGGAFDWSLSKIEQDEVYKG
jgi:ribosomal protein L37AE/L43A